METKVVDTINKYINNKDFLVEIPYFNPVSQRFERISWWKNEKRKCIEGHWINGIWCPGVLYFYINFWNIEVESPLSMGKVIGRPWFRDLEWEKAFIMTEARGFSGFTDDLEFTCNEAVRDRDKLERMGLLDIYIEKGYLRKEDLNKQYIPVREYLYKKHNKNLGKPLYQNECKNVIDLEARGGGKSFWASGCIAHNFLFDGATDYDVYLEKRTGFNPLPLTSQTLVGAIDSGYSQDLLKKFQLGFKNLPGEVEFNGEKYPSPLYINTFGSLQSGKTLTSEISESKIHHRSFKDDPLAANGTRPSLVFLEEVGFMDNIEEALGALKECVAEGSRQFGTIYMFGTGGLFKGLAASHTKNIFFNPKDYNCLAFEDTWEGRGEIGFFVPAYKTLNNFKTTSNFITQDDKSLNFLLEERESVIKNKIKYASEVINRPIKPSEVFFSLDGSFFPLAELKMAQTNFLGNERLKDSSWKGFCVVKDDKIIWKNTNDKPITEWPYKANRMGSGCIEIFEMPVKNSNDEIPSGVYIAGCDPVDDDGFEGSLQSTFILNRLTNRIVAEYTARHETAREYYENLRKLLIFYNATCNYENAKKGLYGHFSNKNCLYLLAETPKILRDQSMVKTKAVGNKAYGTPGSTGINKWARDLSKEWLLEEAYGQENLINADTIRSNALYEEFISFNPDAGNYDRISAFGMLMIYNMEKIKTQLSMEEKTNLSFAQKLDNKFFGNQKKYITFDAATKSYR